jgi:hypothetical protein
MSLWAAGTWSDAAAAVALGPFQTRAAANMNAESTKHTIKCNKRVFIVPPEYVRRVSLTDHRNRQPGSARCVDSLDK